MSKQLGNVLFEGATIGFKNFKGAEGRFNREGERSFAIFLDNDEVVNELLADGWNVKFPKPNPDIEPEEDTRNPYLPVEVKFSNFPPKIVLITGEHHEFLNEDNVAVLDNLRAENVDVIVRPYTWAVNGNSGVKAYCHELYVTAADEALSAKYGF